MREEDALPPSKAKFDKYLEEIRQKEQNVAGTFGEGTLAFNFDGP
jgi:hypothetical protein